MSIYTEKYLKNQSQANLEKKRNSPLTTFMAKQSTMLMWEIGGHLDYAAAVC